MIRNKLMLLLAAVLCTLTACRKDDIPSPKNLAVSATSVWLDGTAEAEATFTLTSSASWMLTVEGDGYEVIPTSGPAGEHPITVRSLAANTASRRATLGRIVVHMEQQDEALRVEVIQRPATAPHAFFFVFIGTSLQQFFDRNMEAALAAMNAEIPGDGRVAALCCNRWQWQIAELRYDPATMRTEQTTLHLFDHPDRSRPEFLTEAISEMMRLVPAREYGLVFGGHGTGWLPKGCDMFGSEAEAARARKAAAADPYPITRYFGEPGSQFDIAEIAASLKATGARFEYLIFDDCFMSNIETLYTLREAARYIVASPCEIMGDGFPYGYVIPALFAEDRTVPERLQQVCEGFYRYYLTEYNPRYPSGCIALTDCDELEALAQAAHPLFATATAPYAPEQLQSYEGLPRHLFYDLLQYAELTATDMGALDAFRAQFDRAFPPECRLHTPSFYSWYSRPNLLPITYYSGVTCSIPSELYPAEVRQTEWWQEVTGRN